MSILKTILILLAITFSLSKQTIQEVKDRLKQIAESPLVNLIFIYDSNKMKSADVKGYLGHMAESKKGYFIINIFDCEEIEQDPEFDYCTESKKKHLPILTFTQPVLNPFNQNSAYGAKQTPYQGALEQKKLYEFAQPLMKTYSRVIKSLHDLKAFKQQNKDVQRVIYVTDKQKLSTYYKALTANFRYNIAFAHVFSNNTKVCSQLKISSFPALVLNQIEPLEINSHISKQIEYMEEFATKQRINITIPAQYNQGDEPIQTKQDLEKKVLLVPKYSVIHITDGKDHPAWKGLKKKLTNSFEYFIADRSMMQELGVKHLPSIVFYHKSISKKESMRTNFNQKMSLKNIIDEITSLIDDFSVTIGSHEEMQRHTGIAFKQNRKVVCLFHGEEVPLAYRILSNAEEYKNKLQFYRYKNPEQSVVEQFRIDKKLPVMMMMYVNDQDFTEKEIKEMEQQNKKRQDAGVQYRLSIGQYNGAYVFEEMKNFLNSFAKQADKKKTTSEEENQEAFEAEQRDLLQVKSMKHLNKYCIKDSCYILLVDNNPQFSESAKRAVNYTRSITKRVFQNVVWADAICHSNLLSIFQVQEEDLPVLIYINHKFQKYSKLIGRLTQQSPNQFISKVKNNRINFRNYQKLSIDDKNCVEEHSRIDSLKHNSEQLSEQQKQILQQIKKEAELKRKQADQALLKNKKKNKKKAKKRVEQQDSEL